MNIRCYLFGHIWERSRVLTLPPEQFVQTQVEANLRECLRCGKQEVWYLNEDYNI